MKLQQEKENNPQPRTVGLIPLAQVSIAKSKRGQPTICGLQWQMRQGKE